MLAWVAGCVVTPREEPVRWFSPQPTNAAPAGLVGASALAGGELGAAPSARFSRHGGPGAALPGEEAANGPQLRPTRVAGEQARILRVGAWNIEHFGFPLLRFGIGFGVQQKPQDIARVVSETRLDVVVVSEIHATHKHAELGWRSRFLDEVIGVLNAERAGPSRALTSRSRPIEGQAFRGAVAVLDPRVEARDSLPDAGSPRHDRGSTLHDRDSPRPGLESPLPDRDVAPERGWRYLLFRNSLEMDGHEVCGVLWNASRVTAVAAWRVPVKWGWYGTTLWNRAPHAVKFSAGRGRTDFVVVPLHMHAGDPLIPAREAEARWLVRGLHAIRERLDDRDLLLIGDTNCPGRDEPALGQYRDAGLIDLNAGQPTTPWGALYDRALIATDFREAGRSLRVVKGGDLSPPMTEAQFRRRLSDHYLIYTEIAVGPDDD